MFKALDVGCTNLEVENVPSVRRKLRYLILYSTSLFIGRSVGSGSFVRIHHVSSTSIVYEIANHRFLNPNPNPVESRRDL